MRPRFSRLSQGVLSTSAELIEINGGWWNFEVAFIFMNKKVMINSILPLAAEPYTALAVETKGRLSAL